MRKITQNNQVLCEIDIIKCRKPLLFLNGNSRADEAGETKKDEAHRLIFFEYAWRYALCVLSE